MRDSTCKASALIFTMALGLASTTFAADWPQWRGPDRTGVATETGLLASWPATGPKLAWKLSGLGAGYAGVAVVGDKLFTLGTRGDQEMLLAYSTADQKELWAAPLGPVWKDKTYPGPRGTPTVDGSLLYAVGPHGDLVCVETTTGNELWRKQLTKDFKGQMATQWGYSESPLVDGDKLICTPGAADAMLVALDKKTGALLWKTAVPALGEKGKDGASYSSPVVLEAGGVRQYVTMVGRGVIGVAAADGKFLWGYNKIANTMALTMTPLVQGDRVFVSTAYGGGSALLQAGPDKVTEVYYLAAKDFQSDSGGAVLVGQHVYGGHGTSGIKLTCLEFATGKVAWQSPSIRGKSLAISAADGKLYCRSGNGQVLLVAATPTAYQELSQFTPEGATDKGWTPPVIANGKLYLRDQDTLYCYDIKAP